MIASLNSLSLHTHNASAIVSCTIPYNIMLSGRYNYSKKMKHIHVHPKIGVVLFL